MAADFMTDNKKVEEAGGWVAGRSAAITEFTSLQKS